MLLRLLRGAGTTGLAGMRPRRGRYIRPLLGVPRAAIEAYCRRFELNPRVDPSNVSPQYLRNRIRHHLLPLLEREYNPTSGPFSAAPPACSGKKTTCWKPWPCGPTGGWRPRGGPTSCRWPVSPACPWPWPAGWCAGPWRPRAFPCPG